MNTHGEKWQRIRKAGMSKVYFERVRRLQNADGEPGARWQELIEFLNQNTHLSPTDMLCLISYDIENNKVRRVIAKYLIRKGCIRVQKSVYLAKVDQRIYREIVSTLKEIQEMYENDDSIFVMPIGEEQLHRLQVIGRNLQIEVLTNPPHTLIL